MRLFPSITGNARGATDKDGNEGKVEIRRFQDFAAYSLGSLSLFEILEGSGEEEKGVKVCKRLGRIEEAHEPLVAVFVGLREHMVAVGVGLARASGSIVVGEHPAVCVRCNGWRRVMGGHVVTVSLRW